jgi:hypothetical protein
LTFGNLEVSFKASFKGEDTMINRRKFASAIWVVFLLFALRTAHADQFDHLTPRASGTGETLSSIGVGNGRLVAVGERGVSLFSDDSIVWTSVETGLTTDLRSVVFGNGIFVAVGDGGAVLTSQDGASWVTRVSGTTSNLTSIAYGNGTFVSVGQNGLILISPDALVWSPKLTGAPNDLNGVSFADGTFVAVGDSGTILTSSSGAAWSVRFSGTFQNLNAVSGGNGEFVVAGQNGTVLTSGDGTTWTARDSGTTVALRAVAFDPDGGYTKIGFTPKAPGVFGAVGDSGVMITSDGGVDWFQQPTETTNSLEAVTFAGGSFIAAGSQGTIAAGLYWLPRDSGVAADLSSVAWGDGVFVAVGSNGTILSSTNGADWTPRESGSAFDIAKVDFAGGIFVAVGKVGVITSTNGIDWVQRFEEGIDKGYMFSGAAYGNGTFLIAGTRFINLGTTALGTNIVLLSIDGVVWEPRSIPISYGINPNGIAFGSGLFCLSSEGAAVTTPDGILWHVSNSGSANSVSFGEGRFVICGNGRAYSEDGTNWLGGDVAYYTAHSVAAGRGGFVAVAAEPADAYQTSDDGVNWVSRGAGRSVVPLVSEGIAYGAGTFVAVGDGGSIFQSVSGPSQLNARKHPDGVEIEMTGDVGRSLKLLSSPTTDPGSSWSVVLNLTNAPYRTNFVDVGSTSGTNRFFRLSTE